MSAFRESISSILTVVLLASFLLQIIRSLKVETVSSVAFRVYFTAHSRAECVRKNESIKEINEHMPRLKEKDVNCLAR